MQIDLLSFIFGAVIAVAIMIIVDRIYTKFWGSKRSRELAREVRKLQAVIKKKDDLINKSLQEMKKSSMEDKK